MMHIEGEDYTVDYDSVSATVRFSGSLRLNGTPEYAPIAELLDRATELTQESMTLDLRALEFLNSSGINVLSKFTIGVRNRGTPALMVRGTTTVPWQTKSLKNLQRLWPSLTLEFD